MLTRISLWRSSSIWFSCSRIICAQPLHFAGVEPVLAFNTAVSFITNTDWQAYGGETTLSILSQMAAITFPMFTSARQASLSRCLHSRLHVKSGGRYRQFLSDLIRFTTRVLVPLASCWLSC